MENNTKLGRLAGLALLLMVLTGIPGVMFRGITSSMLENPDLLSSIIEQSSSMRASILLSFVAGIFSIVFSVAAYQVLSQHAKFIATMYISLWIIQVAVALIGDVSHYMLLEVAQLAHEDSISKTSFLSAAALSVNGYIGAHFLSLIFFSGSFVFLHAHFMKYDLLPKWLTIWGMLATGTVFIVTWLRVFDHYVSFHFYNQNGLFMIGFTAYMLIKGFKGQGKVS